MIYTLELYRGDGINEFEFVSSSSSSGVNVVFVFNIEVTIEAMEVFLKYYINSFAHMNHFISDS